MKKLFAVCLSALFVSALIATAADLVKIGDQRTIGKWRGNEQAALDIDKNFEALDAESVTAATATTTITPQAPAAVTPTITVVGACIGYDSTGAVITNAAGAALYFITTNAATMTIPALPAFATDATASTTISVTK